jgi:hypothetical protein
MELENPYDMLMAGGLAQMQWTWPLDLFNEGLDELLDWIFPVTPGWVQPAYDKIMGFVDKIKSWFSSKLSSGYEYEDLEEFLADYESATAYAESETSDSREYIAALVAAGPGE